MLLELISSRKKLLQQAREIAQLRREIQTLQQQNTSMREGMRRCVSCEYRLDYKERQDDALAVTGNPDT